jgi:heat-inducible transcriptional repressor
MILGLVVREHVRSAEPIGSQTLVEKYDLDISSATVRNEMARLEELGYLTHPHTSAGRVPTDQGYRYFVERLLRDTELPLEERRTIAHQFQQVCQNIDEWMPLAASVLARTAQGAALVTAPQAIQARFRRLQLISMHGRVALLILVFQDGLVKQQTLTLSEPFSQSVLDETSNRINRMCNGYTAAQIEAGPSRLPSLTTFEADILGEVVEIMSRVDATAADRVYHDGLRELLREPEFADEVRTYGVLRMIEEQGFLDMVLTKTLTSDVGGVRVMIGQESRFEELRACSLILSRYGVMGMATGALGVLGPTRMGYSRAISAVRFVSGMLSDLVHDVFAGGGSPPADSRRS